MREISLVLYLFSRLLREISLIYIRFTMSMWRNKLINTRLRDLLLADVVLGEVEPTDAVIVVVGEAVEVPDEPDDESQVIVAGVMGVLAATAIAGTAVYCGVRR